MTTSLLTPLELSGPAVQVAPRRYRKQILPKRTITYKGRTVRFDEPFFKSVIASFNDRAVEQVPWQIADASNNHNNDPERTRGEVVGLEMSADGLDAILDVSEEGEKLLLANPKLGVSARIELNAERANDGKVFPHVIQHVLGTVNPRVVGMRPWEKVDLSAEDGSEIIDLSMEQFDTPEGKMPTKIQNPAPAGPSTKPPAGGDGEKVTVELSKDDHTAFLEMLADQKAAKELALSAPDGDEGEAESDEGEGEVESDEEAPKTPIPPPVDLSAETRAAIELARSTAQTAVDGNLELSNQLRAAQVENELNEFRHQGLAPAVLDLARPVLELAPQSIELSNGDKIDPGENLRKILTEVVNLSATGDLVIDLGREDGVALGTSDSEVTERRAKLDAWGSENY